jgi:hypothetical protein
MNTIDPFLHSIEKSEMSTSGSGFALFLAAAIVGYQCMGIVKKWNEMHKKVSELEKDLEEAKAFQGAQAVILEEHDERLREKKDYDETEEVHVGQVQAWHGVFGTWPLKLEIFISRSKESSIKKNQEWLSWNTEEEADKDKESCTVRDFYLGNSHPDFHWEVDADISDLYRLTVTDTLINGWDNTIHLSLQVTADSRERITDYLDTDSYERNKTENALLKKIIDEKKIEWKRVLLTNNKV